VQPTFPAFVEQPVPHRRSGKRDRENIGGLKMVFEPKYLRFFQARFEPLLKQNIGKVSDFMHAGDGGWVLN
jgi:hypothetical protein